MPKIQRKILIQLYFRSFIIIKIGSTVYVINFRIRIIIMSIFCFSFGGNFLLNIGPTSEGEINVIFEERLRQMGSWLEVNGDSIYKTSPWTHQNDTSDGNVW